MQYSRRSQRIAAIISMLLLAFVTLNGNDFLEAEAWGRTLFLVSILSCGLVFVFLSVKLEQTRITQACLTILLLAVAPLVMVIAVERMNGNFITEFLTDDDLLENYVVALLLYLLVFGISGSARISVLTVSPVLLLFGIANMYVTEFKGSPLVPMDFGSIRTAANVSANYTYEVGYEMVFAIAITAALMAAAARFSMKPQRKAVKIPMRIVSLLVVCGFAGAFYETDMVADAGLKPDFFNQLRGYTNHGAILEFTLNTKYLFLSEPTGYDADEIDDIVLGAESTDILKTALVRQGMDEAEAEAYLSSFTTAGESGVTPNIIVIMNESYSDLRVVGDIETDNPYMEFVDSLKDSTIQGNLYVSTIGTGTSNTEFEFLTGDTMAFLPAGSNAYQLYVKGEMPGLVSTLLAQDYSADAFHPYFESSWNRPAVYEYMGFEDFISVEDIIDQDIIDQYKSSGYSYKLYQRLLKQRYPQEDILLRRFVSDAYDFKQLEKMYEEKDADTPMFVFNITMQNHSSYNQDYDNFTEEVKLTNTKREYEKTNQYLSLIRKTDEAFEDLIDYFSNVDEPTIILMFGDHQPFIEDSFYSEVMGQSISEMDDETQQQRYITRFILWANYDIPSAWIDEISANYLSTLLLQVAGLETTDYSDYLSSLYAEVPVITAMGCRDSEGNFFQADESNSHEDLIADYRRVQYNNLADLDNRVDSLFYLGEEGDD